jgi:hypothetical protein
MTGRALIHMGRTVGMSDAEVATEIGVPLWQLRDSRFRALMHRAGHGYSWETELVSQKIRWPSRR